MKGKAKATMEDVARWEVDEHDLPVHHQGSKGLGLARSILAGAGGRKSPLGERMEDLEFTVRPFDS